MDLLDPFMDVNMSRFEAFLNYAKDLQRYYEDAVNLLQKDINEQNVELYSLLQQTSFQITKEVEIKLQKVMDLRAQKEDFDTIRVSLKILLIMGQIVPLFAKCPPFMKRYYGSLIE